VTTSIGWFEAIVLGVVQGLTEFLPISSSAHILVVSQLLQWPDPGAAFTAVSQIGTELAVIIYFRRDLARIISTWFRSLRDQSLRSNIDARMGWYIIIGTIPISILGLTFAASIETTARNLWLVAAMLIIFGVVLGVSDRVGRKQKPLASLNIRDGIIFGLGQALALIPGVSRSGATISTGLLLGYTREAAARYSFLLAIPAILASGFYEATKIGQDTTVAWGPTILGTAIAFVIGYAVIAWLLRWVTTHSFLPFVLYRIGLGMVLIVLLAFGVLTPIAGA
jgi:undecaprenyl-diphosphatase